MTQPIQKQPLQDGVFLTGLFLILLSAGIFVLPDSQIVAARDSFFGMFFIHYIIAILYFITISVNGFVKFRWRLAKNNITYTLLFLVLCLISAFALNRELPIFQQSTEWLSIYLVITCMCCIVYAFRKYLPVFAQHILYFMLGAGFLLLAYFAIYLLPIYGIGLIAFFFLGISLHTFVPLLFCLYLALVFKKAFQENKQYLFSTIAGFVLPLLFFFYFLTGWISTQKLITDTADEAILESNTDLPQWVVLSQKLPASWITERVIKSELVYDIPRKNIEFWDLPNRSFDEIKKHDPLVMAASYFYNRYELEVNDRIKILEVMYDARHQAQDRLWSGKDLQTAHVITHAKLFPEYRLAYTEKIISIRNTGRQEKWDNNEQEAIYTFHMPEGSVVTSLSLWINGVEEKAYLTTKSKADSAYKTIVGVEVRDPSVVHWQEGNTVSVRVFPCTPDASRRFKIGIASPLRKDRDSLVYENIYFQGPDFSHATENVSIQFDEHTNQLDAPLTFISTKARGYQYKGNYKPYWEITCNAPALSNLAFTFDGKSYYAEEYIPQLKALIPQEIYLDVNQSWTKEEFDQVWQLVKNKKVYVYTNRLVQLNEEIKDELFNDLHGLRFSLFPLHQIKHRESALLITKSEGPSPNVKDLKESVFAQSLKRYLREKQAIHTYSLSHQLSPYMKTLKELRVFTYAQGDIKHLEELLQTKRFVKEAENEQSVVINHAQLRLAEKEGMLPSQAPDHLLRLFTYNNIMRKVNTTYLAENFVKDDLVAAAEKAYVVSPVSSLIVLETQKDYERFNIEKSKNSLQNASMKSSGAVPEPHEWMLIILMVAVVTFFLCKHYVWR